MRTAAQPLLVGGTLAANNTNTAGIAQNSTASELCVQGAALAQGKYAVRGTFLAPQMHKIYELSQSGGHMTTEEETITDKAQHAAQDLKTRLSEATETAKSRTSEFATQTAAKARQATSDLGHQMKEFGGRIRERSPHETVRNTTNRVADTIENAGAYLEEKNLDGMLEDLAGVIRRYPLQSLLAGVAIGFLLSRKRRDEF
jgi:hypothetical protein